MIQCSEQMSRITTRIDLKPSLIGVSTYLIVNEYRGKNSDEKLAYIQASLHGKIPYYSYFLSK
jgi:hypothetical protein